MMKEDKITGWLATCCMKVMKVWTCSFRDCGFIIERKHDNASVEPKKHTTKMCSAYLKLCNEKNPSSIAEKR